MNGPLRQRRVVVGVSGGVDSAVAALLLQQQGYEVHGLFMRNWEEDEDAYCSSADDLQEARRVCETLGIPLHTVSFAKEYREQVFAHFLREYARGRTPNPDVLCNREIKFGRFLDYAQRLGAERIATGHYARVVAHRASPRLLMAADQHKDQTYFLHAVPAAALARTLFPLGELHKGAVRELARDHGLRNFARKDSTGICFIGERPFRQFLSRYLPARPGEIRSLDGRLLGEHQGLMYYTLGQRQGLGLGGQRGSRNEPWYVVAKDLETNVLTVAQGAGHALLLSGRAVVENLHWIAGRPPPLPARCRVRLRHRQSPQACTAIASPANSVTLHFERPQRAVTPGQYAVLYSGETCLGGGAIAVTARPGDFVDSGSAEAYRGAHAGADLL